MKSIVLSGVNISDMGPAVVFEEALQTAVELYGDNYRIVAFVHRKDVYSITGVTYYEFPKVKASWLRRLFFEYFTLNRISRSLNVALWVSMHDMTPYVKAERRAVYCHNPAPFYKLNLREAFRNWKLAAFVLMYGYIYGVNIQKNDFVIVQQDWMRQAFIKRYNLKRVVVAHPVINHTDDETLVSPFHDKSRVYTFIYPAFPRSFKNYEVILDAAELLENEYTGQYEILLTLDASINSYAADLERRYRHLRNVRWLGILPHKEVLELYTQSDCLLFSSKLETWGLPISEFKTTRKPMIVADLPYARETVGSYHQVTFFEATNSSQLAGYMKDAIRGIHMFSEVQASWIAHPFATDWHILWKYLMIGSTE
jgi:glycosyltransferase involved in cell wall biosynthesis